MDYYVKSYGELGLHRRMVSDRPRTEGFARAIAEVVSEGDVVLDLGTGTGLLAMLAARAGAHHVYAVDQAEVAETAVALVRENGLADRVTVLQRPAARLKLTERVDVLVSEWLGNLALAEGMLDDVLAARDAHLTPGGCMLPAAVEVLLAPASDPARYTTSGPGFWRDPVHGLDLSSLEDAELRQGRAVRTRVSPEALLAPGQALVALDLATAGPEEPWAHGRLSFEAARSGVLDGFVGWFSARLSPSIVLETGPHRPPTHWAQSYFAFPPRPVTKGTVLEVGFQLRRDPVERRDVGLGLTLGTEVHWYLIE